MREDGVIIADTNDGRIETATAWCCHCGTHFTEVRGSGRIRGFCMKCMAKTCGAPGCDACYPIEKRLDDYERGKLGVLQ